MCRLTIARCLLAYGYVPRMPLVIAPTTGGPGLHHCPADLTHPAHGPGPLPTAVSQVSDHAPDGSARVGRWTTTPARIGLPGPGHGLTA